MTSESNSLRKRVEAVLDMAVSTVSSLGEAFTAGAPLHMEDAAHAGEAEKSRSGTSPLPSIAEHAEESKGVPEVVAEDTSMKEADEKPDGQEDAEEVEPDVRGGEEDEEDDEEEEDEEDDGVLEVHG